MVDPTPNDLEEPMDCIRLRALTAACALLAPLGLADCAVNPEQNTLVVALRGPG